MKHPYRTHLGEQFNEGARLAWLAKDERGFSNADLARIVGCARSHLGKILYGDQRPGRSIAAHLQEELGVPMMAWDQPPSSPFSPPAARDDESTPTLAVDDEDPSA